MIHFQSRTKNTTENWHNADEDFEKTNIYEDFLNIILQEDIDIRRNISNDVHASLMQIAYIYNLLKKKSFTFQD